MSIGDRHSASRGRIVFDMVLVVVSVLMGLALGNWRDDQERAKLKTRVLESLSREIAANRTAIDSALDYQDRMTKAFREANELYQSTREFRYPEEAKGRKAAVRFSRAAYDSAIVSQVLPRIEVDTLLKLSALYGEQDAYADAVRNYAMATLQVDFSDGSRYFRLLSNEYAQLAQSERELQPLLTEADAAVQAELAH
jgi:type II secretory pathway pseudopilin PulG